MSNELPLLQTRIEQVYQCEAVHRESAQIHEMMDGQTLWKGWVEIFELFGHREAKACYAWLMNPGGANSQIVTVLGKPPVASPAMAVRAAIFFDMQPVQHHYFHRWKQYPEKNGGVINEPPVR